MVLGRDERASDSRRVARSAAARSGAGHTAQYTDAEPTATSGAPPSDSNSAAIARTSSGTSAYRNEPRPCARADVSEDATDERVSAGGRAHGEEGKRKRAGGRRRMRTSLGERSMPPLGPGVARDRWTGARPRVPSS